MAEAARAFWTIYPNADRAAVANLVERLSAELRIPVPPLLDSSVALPHDKVRVVAALDNVQPNWRDLALILPP